MALSTYRLLRKACMALQESGLNPWWVDYMNRALERNAGATLVAFVLVDVGTALCLLGVVLAFDIPVDAEFAVAYAVAKVRIGVSSKSRYVVQLLKIVCPLLSGFVSELAGRFKP